MNVSKEIYDIVYEKYGKYYSSLTGESAEKITKDVLSFEKPNEQIEILARYAGELRGKNLLEIGSGFGIFTTVGRKTYGIETYGIEPGSEGFGGSYELSLEVLKQNGVDPVCISQGVGEELPYRDNSFDVIFSTNVLEHVTDPKKVLTETIRVCKPGGIIQIIVPSYGSFFDGHYSCFYFPYQPQWFWSLWIKYVLRKDPSYAGTIRTSINYFSVKKWLKPMLRNNNISIVSMGEEIFYERMNKMNFSTWAGLGKVKKWLNFLRKIGMVKFVTWCMIKTKSWTPLIITLRKNH